VRYKMPKLTLKERLVLGKGKLRRFYYGFFRKNYVRQSHARRRGECKRCGACCNLMHRCLSCDMQDGMANCKTYTWRPRNCRIFPVDEQDLRDRELLSHGIECGFYFENGNAPRDSNNEEGARK